MPVGFDIAEHDAPNSKILIVRSIVFLSFLMLRSMRAFRWRASLSASAGFEAIQPMIQVHVGISGDNHESLIIGTDLSAVISVATRRCQCQLDLNQGCDGATPLTHPPNSESETDNNSAGVAAVAQPGSQDVIDVGLPLPKTPIHFELIHATNERLLALVLSTPKV